LKIEHSTTDRFFEGLNEIISRNETTKLLNDIYKNSKNKQDFSSMVNKSSIYSKSVFKINKIITNSSIDIDKSYSIIKDVLKTDEPEYAVVDFMIKMNRHIKGKKLTIDGIMDMIRDI